MMNTMNSIAIYALTPKGAALARTLACEVGGSIFLPERMVDAEAVLEESGFQHLRECVAETFGRFTAHVFITAAGIAVRAIAQHLVSKDVDPAVVVLDQNGEHVISLLSGHLGGANRFAQQIAQIIGGVAVITTATDTEKLPSVDMVAQEAGCVIHNLDAVKYINGALLAGEQVILDDPADVLSLKRGTFEKYFLPAELVPFSEEEAPSIVVSWRSAELLELEEKTLLLHPKVLTVGVGAKRGASKDAILQLIQETFSKHDLALGSVARLVSVDAKKDEQGIIQAANVLGVPFETFSAELLNEIDVPNPSDAPKNAVGTKSVAEAAALHGASSQQNARLVVEKQKGNGVTCAVALEI